MDEEQRFMRYVFPGIVTALAVVLALVAADPQLIRRFIQLGIRMPWSSLGWSFAALIGSGGLGFLLAQMYFGLPSWFNIPDHRGKPRNKSIRKKWEALRHACQDNQARQQIQVEKHYEWQRKVADCHPALNKDSARYASRMASLGTTNLGLVVGLFLWLWLILDPFFAIHPSPCGSVLGAFGFFLAPFFLLCMAHHKIRLALEYTVQEGLP